MGGGRLTFVLVDHVSKDSSQALQDVEHLSDIVPVRSAAQIGFASATGLLSTSDVS